MLFALRFTNKPGTAELYQGLMAAHLRWLKENRSTVLVAGPLRTEPGAISLGALWIVEAPTKADAQKVFETDPFWTQGLRESVEVLHWSKALPDRPAVL
jgi:uncharacterized protein